MNQQIVETHDVDKNGNPTGGYSTGVGIDIRWQNGPLRELAAVAGEPPTEIARQNGAFIEGVINAALGRLEFYQKSKFRCRENAMAIASLEIASMWLHKRTADREVQGIEGTHGLRESEG